MTDERVVNVQQVLAAKIIEMFSQLIQEPPGEGKSRSATMDRLQQLLPQEVKAQFNEDMKSSIEMVLQFPLCLSDKVIATGILPHCANFLARQIAQSVFDYSPLGCPVRLKVTIADEDRTGMAEIFYAYSMAGQSEVNAND